MNIDRAQHLDVMSFPCSIVLMEAHLQAKWLHVWLVTYDNRNNEIMMLLQSLSYCSLLVIVCSIVFLLARMHMSFRMLSMRTIESQRMCKMKSIMVA